MSNSKANILDWDKVRKIRALYVDRKNSGVSQKSLACDFGVCNTTIYEVVRGRAWHDPEYTPPLMDALKYNKPTARVAGQVRKIYEESFLSQGEIGKRFNLIPSVVSRIIRNQIFVDDSYTPPERCSCNRLVFKLHNRKPAPDCEHHCIICGMGYNTQNDANACCKDLPFHADNTAYSPTPGKYAPRHRFTWDG